MEQPLFHFMTLIKEIEAIINSRPLTVLPDSPNAPEALTPAHFLTLNLKLTLPAGSLAEKGRRDDQLVNAWRLREKGLNDFWGR